MKKILFLCLLIIVCGCTSLSNTEKYENQRDQVVEVHDQIKEIQIEEVLVGSIARIFLMDDYMLIGDYRALDKQIHIFDKNDFSYITSLAPLGQGPGEITVMGHIGIDEVRHKFYVSDHGKQKIFSYCIDSVIINPDYMPDVMTEMNMVQFPDKYYYINDTLSIALLIEPTSSSTFNQSVAKWNIKDGKFENMKYKHPDIEKKRITFAVSTAQDTFVECYLYHDLMTICTLSGDLKYNIYGPSWDKTVSNKKSFYGGVTFCGDRIVASYSGGDNFSDEYYPTKLLVFDVEGNYIKTLDVGYKIVNFCYDEVNERIIMNLNDDIQFAYLEAELIR